MSASQQVNTFKDSFFFPSEQKEVMTTAIDSKDFSSRGKSQFYYASVYLRAAAKQSGTTWYRIYFTDYISNLAALALSAMSACHILLKYQHVFTQRQQLIGAMYAEAYDRDDKSDDESEDLSGQEDQDQISQAKKKFKEQIKAR